MGEMIIAAKTGGNFDRIMSEAMASQEGGHFSGSVALMTVPAVGTITALLAFVMIINTYFGFEGVQRFAQYVAVPVILIWGIFATILAFTTVSADVLAAVPEVSTPTAMIMVIGGMVGLAPGAMNPISSATPRPAEARGGTSRRSSSPISSAPSCSRLWAT